MNLGCRSKQYPTLQEEQTIFKCRRKPQKAIQLHPPSQQQQRLNISETLLRIGASKTRQRNGSERSLGGRGLLRVSWLEETPRARRHGLFVWAFAWWAFVLIIFLQIAVSWFVLWPWRRLRGTRKLSKRRKSSSKQRSVGPDIMLKEWW